MFKIKKDLQILLTITPYSHFNNTTIQNPDFLLLTLGSIYQSANKITAYKIKPVAEYSLIKFPHADVPLISEILYVFMIVLCPYCFFPPPSLIRSSISRMYRMGDF